MNRDERVEWTKQRALAELEPPGGGGVVAAIASVQSDLGKHPETQGHTAIELMMMLAMGGHLSTPIQVREFIDGIR